ncbi:MAG TPA: glycosyltransferase family 9 protein [Stellaceae bacterium]|nr:glycosyltransferase family 9 protein [Stellaceae bacterium]
MNRPPSILFITATRIGDAVLSTGLLSYLIERHPGARLTIAAGPIAAPLFEAVPGLDRLLVLRKRRWSLHWPALYARTMRCRWDIVVDLRGSAIAWMLRAGERRVMAKGDAREHRVRQLARLFDLDTPPGPTVWTAPRHERAAAELLPPGAPVLAIGPAANWRGKQWRGERFAALALRLTAGDGVFPGARIAVLAGAHEYVQAAPLLAAIPAEHAIDLVGRTELLTAAALLRRCAMFIGNDTGLMHIAAAAGTPTLGLFGPSPAEQYAPWGTCTDIVRTSVPREAMFGPGFDPLTTGTLMDSLSVEAVATAAAHLWQRSWKDQAGWARAGE